MYGHSPGTKYGPSDNKKKMRFIDDQKFSYVGVQMAHNNIYTLYVHSNIMSVIRLVVITQVISHSVAGHQGLPSVHAKLTNTIMDAYTPSCVCYRPHGDKQNNVNFLVVTTASSVCM